MKPDPADMKPDPPERLRHPVNPPVLIEKDGVVYQAKYLADRVVVFLTAGWAVATVMAAVFGFVVGHWLV